MDAEKIIETISDIFHGADERDWEKVKSSFAQKVLLDYYSMNGAPASVVTSQDIIDIWKGFLPGFDLTLHHISEFKIEQSNAVANAHFLGKADHFIDGERWTVEGTYDLELAIDDNSAKVTKFKLNLLNQSGNIGLPQRAEMALKK